MIGCICRAFTLLDAIGVRLLCQKEIDLAYKNETRSTCLGPLGVGVMPAPNIMFSRSLEENERAMVATASPAEITRNPELVDAMTHRIIVRYA
jgi:hypothetical protein